MLAFHTDAQKTTSVDISEGALPKDVVWIDLLDANAQEIAFVEQATGLRVPTRKALSEVESSSRLSSEGGALYLSTPMLVSRAGSAGLAPLGFVLSQTRLLTIRFDSFRAFDAFAEQGGKALHGRPGGTTVFVGLLEELIDLLADALEDVAADLDTLSNRIFGPEITTSSGAKPPRRRDLALRAILRKIGRTGQLLSKIRASLLGIGRMVPYAENRSEHWTGAAELKPRFERLRRDVSSLDEFEVHLTDKVQFLLDATLGLISIEQNNTFKVLTIASVVGIPPTLVASIYGMNFKNMPELDWSWGYAYGLALIALSAVVPIVWFKLRGWF